MNFEKIAAALLNEAMSTITAHNSQSQPNGSSLNLIELLRLSCDETKMCKILAEILNPQGSHFQGDKFLNSFFSILNITPLHGELSAAKVITEYPTGESRRIDIAILTPLRFVPIEVKIYAKDQPAQCKSYFDFAASLNKPCQSPVYYLSLDGHLPSGEGASGLTPNSNGYNEVIPLSFLSHIIPWLKECINICHTHTPVAFTLEQIKYSIERLCGKVDNELKNKISTLISDNPKTLKAAVAISESISTARTAMLLKLFSALEAEMKKAYPHLEQLTDKFDYKFNNNDTINNFYKHKASTCPALTYRYKKLDNNTEIWFRIEVDFNLFCGFVTAKNGENPQKQVLSDKEITLHFNFSHLSQPLDYYQDGWWIYWEYLPLDDPDAAYTPNFKYNNDIFYNLFDENFFQAFIADCTASISSMLSNLPRPGEEGLE